MSSPRSPRSPRRADVTTVELVGGVEKRRLVLDEYDPTGPHLFAEHEARIRAAPGMQVVAVEHVGSTSVPGLAAKPIIDVLVTVEDITAEEDHLQPLLGAGCLLRVREPGHRMVRRPALDVHVHLHEVGGAEAQDKVRFRDRLRCSAEDRMLYACTKRRLVARDWPDMNAYAEVKGDVVAEIMARSGPRSAR